jgi:hypothetical protein
MQADKSIMHAAYQAAFETDNLTIVLLTSDGDFSSLCTALKQMRNVNVVVIGRSEPQSPLAQAAALCVNWTDLLHLVCELPPTANIADTVSLHLRRMMSPESETPAPVREPLIVFDANTSVPEFHSFIPAELCTVVFNTPAALASVKDVTGVTVALDPAVAGHAFVRLRYKSTGKRCSCVVNIRVMKLLVVGYCDNSLR